MPNYISFPPKSKMNKPPEPLANQVTKEPGFFDEPKGVLLLILYVCIGLIAPMCLALSCNEKYAATAIEQREAAAEKMGVELLELKADELIIIQNGEHNVQKIYRIPADSLQHWADSLYGH